MSQHKTRLSPSSNLPVVSILPYKCWPKTYRPAFEQHIFAKSCHTICGWLYGYRRLTAGILAPPGSKNVMIAKTSEIVSIKRKKERRLLLPSLPPPNRLCGIVEHAEYLPPIFTIVNPQTGYLLDTSYLQMLPLQSR